MLPAELNDGHSDRPECRDVPSATVTKLAPEDIDRLLDALHIGVVPATGCTEPVALALAAARARLALGLAEELPDDLRIEARVSRNIIWPSWCQAPGYLGWRSRLRLEWSRATRMLGWGCLPG
ncbi:hypothetical protein PH31N_05128 [Cutibacterium modestum 31N]|nr:hypothetical protein [Cutibacterium modestum 31N]